eukprot:6346603-Pyramimonas_sp.AAC.1
MAPLRLGEAESSLALPRACLGRWTWPRMRPGWLRVDATSACLPGEFSGRRGSGLGGDSGRGGGGEGTEWTRWRCTGSGSSSDCR